jgi:hypothetical protein
MPMEQFLQQSPLKIRTSGIFEESTSPAYAGAAQKAAAASVPFQAILMIMFILFLLVSSLEISQTIPTTRLSPSLV